ncbi:helix-turn-helix domain-containing protein [Gordonia sp. ABSL1-1]|uniref:TetR/AcrR family transcriptional regulator n=1 Tax=Gordonia sp. ABSL1-1 TaxID=3053923 RepID=UPI00257443C0|nr:helix-turn-helix domain-containing protein [Gordonia sp. ABSL1-1]MDL9935176.1 helix-turn-helix domain-containing protein [Gordonia sp. ABSL1-1]
MPTQKPDSRAGRPDRKRQLVEHAAELFLLRGYAQVSVADVARAAGVTAPSVYRHFDDKQSLLVAAVMAGVDELVDCTDRALAAPDRTIDDLITAACRLGVTRPGAASLWRWTSNYLTDEQNVLVARRTRDVVGRWAACVAADRPDLSERESVQLASAVLSICGSLSVHHSRMSEARARAELSILVHRVIALHPASAPPLPPVAPLTDPTITRRDQILDAAADLFADRGYSNVGVDDIGAAVGITGPSVYKHFSSKLAILVAIGQRSAMRLEAGVLAAFSATSDPAKLLGLLVDSYVSVITSTPDLSVAFNSAAILAGKPPAVELLDIQRRYVARWTDLLLAVDNGLKRDQATVAVHAALSIINDAVRMRRGVGRPEFAARMAYLMKGVLDV